MKDSNFKPTRKKFLVKVLVIIAGIVLVGMTFVPLLPYLLFGN